MSASPPVADRGLLVVAWLNAGLHALGLVLAAWGMRPGTPAVPLDERLRYLANDPLGWQLGWAIWMLCVPAVVAFFCLAARRVRSLLAWTALGVVLAAGTVDLCCDTTFQLVFPAVAARGPAAELLFLTMERAVGAVSLIVANGFYSLASLLMTLALRRGVETGRGTKASILVGYGVAGFGFLLAGAGFTGVPWQIEWATGPTLGLYCVWTILVAHALQTCKAAP